MGIFPDARAWFFHIAYFEAMAPTDSIVGINDIDATELPDYRPLCVPAAVGLAMGALSFLALLHPVMCFVPVLAIGVNVYALVLLARSDRMVGRAAAVCGLCLALIFGVTEPVRVISYHWLAYRDGSQFGRQWIQAIQDGNLYLAHQMSVMPNDRKAPGDDLPALYSKSDSLRTELENYLKTPAITTLRSLGTRATVRHYQTERVETDGRHDLVEDVYAVTYDEDGRPKTFFIKLNMWRNLKSDAGPRLWRVQGPDGAYRPKGWS